MTRQEIAEFKAALDQANVRIAAIRAELGRGPSVRAEHEVDQIKHDVASLRSAIEARV